MFELARTLSLSRRASLCLIFTDDYVALEKTDE